MLIKDELSVLFNSNISQISLYVRITVFFIQHLSCDAPGPPTDGALWLEDGLVVLGVVDLSRRQLLVRLVLARAPPLPFGAPPVRLWTVLQPDDITNICLFVFRRKTANFLLYLLLLKNLEEKLFHWSQIRFYIYIYIWHVIWVFDEWNQWLMYKTLNPGVSTCSIWSIFSCLSVCRTSAICRWSWVSRSSFAVPLLWGPSSALWAAGRPGWSPGSRRHRSSLPSSDRPRRTTHSTADETRRSDMWRRWKIKIT